MRTSYSTKKGRKDTYKKKNTMWGTNTDLLKRITWYNVRSRLYPCPNVPHHDTGSSFCRRTSSLSSPKFRQRYAQRCLSFITALAGEIRALSEGDSWARAVYASLSIGDDRDYRQSDKSCSLSRTRPMTHKCSCVEIAQLADRKDHRDRNERRHACPKPGFHHFR